MMLLTIISFVALILGGVATIGKINSRMVFRLHLAACVAVVAVCLLHGTFEAGPIDIPGWAVGLGLAILILIGAVFWRAVSTIWSNRPRE
jgi:hypothetical protein